MGLPKPVIQLLFSEHSHRAITGDVLFVGRQTTYATSATLASLGSLYGVSPHAKFSVEIDNETMARMNHGGGKVTDRCLMSYFGARSFKAMDVSAYEGADIVCDISAPIPQALHNSFDLVFDGSCLDNIFDPAQAMRNISDLLRPNGRAILMNHGTWMNGPYSICSPGWYFDFFASNAYADCQVFLGQFNGDATLHLGPMPMLFYNWNAHRDGNLPAVGQHVLIVVVAEKGFNSTSRVNPIQHQYRDSVRHSEFNGNAQRIMQSGRRLIGTPRDLPMDVAFVPVTTLGESIP